MTKKQFVAFARVSSREQEKEGFSLSVQVEAMQRYAQQHNGEICKAFTVAETASKRDERKYFKQLIEWSIKHAHEIDGILFYKVDRAVRNMQDMLCLEGLRNHGINVIFITQECPDTPTGRLYKNMLASMATFQTDQQSQDIKEGVERRVKEGLFP